MEWLWKNYGLIVVLIGWAFQAGVYYNHLKKVREDLQQLKLEVAADTARLNLHLLDGQIHRDPFRDERAMEALRRELKDSLADLKEESKQTRELILKVLASRNPTLETRP